MINFFNNFFPYKKISKNFSAKYYQENKERLQRKARERYQNLSTEKEKKQQYGRERYKNLSEDEKKTKKKKTTKKTKKKLVEYRKKYYRLRKDTFENFASL